MVGKAEAAFDGSVSWQKSLHKAEQVRLLVRLAADSGARRGELAAFKFSDLDGRVLTIERGVSGEQIGPTKNKRTRRLTLGRTTVELWRASEQTWRG
jgi:integrase